MVTDRDFILQVSTEMRIEAESKETNSWNYLRMSRDVVLA